jgi:hypothetical protein
MKNIALQSIVLCAFLALSACESPPISVEDSQLSPDGQWLAEVSELLGAGRLSVTLRQAGYFSRQHNILIYYLDDKGDPGFLLKWLSNSNLVVAAANERYLPKKSDNIEGIKISYLVYSTDPDSFQDERSKRVIVRKLQFTSTFREHVNIGTPAGAGCEFTVATSDERPEKRVQLRLTADKDLYVKARYSLEKAPSYSYMTISAPQRYVTAAAFDSFPIAKGASTVPVAKGAVIHRNLNSVGNPGWWASQRIDRGDLFSILDRLKSGLVEFKFGLWLDNTEEVYTNLGPANLNTIQAFEQCIAQNTIFE